MATPYDIVAYPNLCQAQTHPDRLAVVANLLGLDPAAPDQCRVLEFGCGTGANLLPLAAAFPASRFTGVDLAETAIAAGREAIRAFELTNFELRGADILDFQPETEPYDYIIAHGVYSWIPAAARDALLARIRDCLAPEGVAYISYNCLPGCHLRRMVREVMRFHTRAVGDPLEQVRQAVAVCQFIARSIEKPDTYRQLFKEQLEQVQRYGAGHLFHDDLAEINDPVYFHELAAHAARHGLQYLGEADFFEMQDEAFSAEARAVLAQMEDSRLTREQYLDFVKCRRFRQTLLCRAEAPLRYPAQADGVPRFHISSRAQETPHGMAAEGRPIIRFADPNGGAIEVGHPLGIRALRRAAARWPATVPFAELLADSRADGTAGSLGENEARAVLAEILLEAYRAAVVEFHRVPTRCATKASERPAASRFARRQLQRGATVTTLRYENLKVEDEAGRRLFLLLDGTRTWAELEDCVPPEPETQERPSTTKHDRLARRLDELARLALLEA